MINRVIIFSDAKTPLKGFEPISKSSKWEISALPCSALRKEMRNPDENSLYVLDYASVPDSDKAKDLKYILKKDDFLRAVADRKNEINDPAELLMNFCDYFGSGLLKEGIKPARISKFEDWLYSENPGSSETASGPLPEGCPETPQADSSRYIIPENGWDGIKAGKEYSFYMMYTEVQIPQEWKKKSGNVHLNQIKQTFQAVAERYAAELNGRLWIWNEYGGLILFPFTGKTCTPVIMAVKLMLNRVLISIEDFHLHAPVNIRASMHLGTTKWHARGDTGTIISDSINSIFHLGTKYTPPDNFDITEEVYLQLNSGLRELFSNAGIFEERNIFRLCKPVFIE